MLAQFNEVWNTLGSIIGAIPSEIITVVSFVYCAIGVVGFFKTL